MSCYVGGDAVCAQQVLELSPSGKLLRTLGTGLLSNPQGVAVDGEDRLLVADGDTETLYRQGRNGELVPFHDFGTLEVAPVDLATDADGTVFVLMASGSTIWMVWTISPRGQMLGTTMSLPS